ncbi:elongation factor P maturation arginine rhamnosyltransferase EarP [Pseudomonas sp. Gutcm_11s]|uniref:elongation factor P maturation arginine rhamnosyltransferase EarP n=1 Tax=Pseudomonas sp. Gutcm_11s TaxID=3026088 RepID=UPI0023605C78|nr:elongation factor P maturation arginine rhamnosyltransferase EarP [Pseudomonas sp. Gutcm_11s]MDD0841605.1 elongation factor P maturation arginine rhamnosyltransferase EarP [Pseudomonas sp. Gutcm_11s]
MGARWDIFCSVVDNYGDIGVTWRLARQLAAEHGLAVRLWVDEPAAFLRLCPQAAAGQESWLLAGVEVHHWPKDFLAVEPADVVIEAFACTLPENYVAAMAARASKPLWLNLEYLSAEDWVAGCHGLPSPQPGGLQKFFFFPGFTEGTGGLLREADLLPRRRAFQADGAARQAFLDSLGIQPLAGARLISLFAYENAGLAPWLDALAGAGEATQLLVPRGRIEADLCRWLGVDSLEEGGSWRRGNLQLHLLPFLSQPDYDLLLWSCDFNAIRGEDSFVRAQWAGRPLLWHIYQQEEGAHWDKLDAFLDCYCGSLSPPAAAALKALWHAWNGQGDMGAAWAGFLAQENRLTEHAEAWCVAQATRPDLAAALVQFHRNWLSCAA